MSESGQNRTLTRGEKLVLAVCINPEHFKSTDTQKIAATGISRSRYYAIIADPWFHKQIQSATMNFIGLRIAPIVEAAVSTAMVKGKDGHQDRKMLLQMSGMLGRDDSAEDAERALDGLVSALNRVADGTPDEAITETGEGIPGS
jgi:hypothetical protein